VESIEQLKAVIDAKGQQIKPQLFEHQLASLIQWQKVPTRLLLVRSVKKEPSSKVTNTIS